MTLTSQLNNPNSPLSSFFRERMKSPLDPIVTAYNQLIGSHPPLRGTGNIDFLMAGSAFGYLWKWHFRPMRDLYMVASECSVKFRPLYRAIVERGDADPSIRPELACLMYGLEQNRRTREVHPILHQFTRSPTPLLPSPDGYGGFGDTIADVRIINDAFLDAWGSATIEERFISSPDFVGSDDVGGADAFAIVGDTLWDVKTTVKRSPFTAQNLLQQIAYVMLDYFDEYKIRNIGWYYSRQRVQIVTPLDKLVRDITALREAWQDYIDENIIDDPNDGDYLIIHGYASFEDFMDDDHKFLP